MLKVSNAGAEQIATQMKGEFESADLKWPGASREQVGLKLLPKDKLSFDQVAQLSDIFTAGGNQSDVKAAALKVLSINCPA